MQASSTHINVRVAPAVRDRIDRAAGLRNMSRTDFILEASAKAADQVLLDQTVFHLTDSQMAEFDALMSRPISANPALLKLLSKKALWEA